MRLEVRRKQFEKETREVKESKKERVI